MPLVEVRELRARLVKVSAWEGEAAKVAGVKADLRALHELYKDAEALRIALPAADELRERYLAAKKWMGIVNNQLLRRTAKRAQASGITKPSIADVENLITEAGTLMLDASEIEQVEARLHEAKAWREQAAALLAPDAPLGEAQLAELTELVERTEEIPVAMEGQEQLECGKATVSAWVTRATAALAKQSASQDQAEMGELILEARRLRLALPQLPLLAARLEQETFLKQAEAALSATTELDTLRALVEQAEAMAPADGGRAAEVLAQLKAKCEAGREWTERLAGELERRRLRDAQAMLTEAEGCGVVINEIVAIKEALGRARVWQEAARKLQARSSTRGTVEKATLDELTLLAQGEALEVVCPDIPYLAQSLRSAEEWQRRAEAALDAQPHAVAGGSSGEEKAVKALRTCTSRETR